MSDMSNKTEADLAYKSLERPERIRQLRLLDSVGRLDAIDMNSLTEIQLDALEREVIAYERGRLQAWTRQSQ